MIECQRLASAAVTDTVESGRLLSCVSANTACRPTVSSQCLELLVRLMLTYRITHEVHAIMPYMLLAKPTDWMGKRRRIS